MPVPPVTNGGNFILVHPKDSKKLLYIGKFCDIDGCRNQLYHTSDEFISNRMIASWVEMCIFGAEMNPADPSLHDRMLCLQWPDGLIY
jgi:hypothetical protein